MMNVRKTSICPPIDVDNVVQEMVDEGIFKSKSQAYSEAMNYYIAVLIAMEQAQ